jgi:hypothetical protein
VSTWLFALAANPPQTLQVLLVFEYIELFYNRQRCHSATGYLAPLAYEQALKTNAILCPEKC